MIKELKTNSNLIICEEVSDDTINWQSIDVSLDWNKHKLLGLLKDLTDSDVGKFVELTNTGLYKNYIWSDLKVKETCIQPLSNSAKQSFISLLQSEGVDVSKNIIVIEKL